MNYFIYHKLRQHFLHAVWNENHLLSCFNIKNQRGGAQLVFPELSTPQTTALPPFSSCPQMFIHQPQDIQQRKLICTLKQQRLEHIRTTFLARPYRKFCGSKKLISFCSQSYPCPMTSTTTLKSTMADLNI